jgi:hypothetical protein
MLVLPKIPYLTSKVIHRFYKEYVHEYHPEEEYIQTEEERYQPQQERLISNVFEDQERNTRGARRHYQSNQQSSDIFFQNEAPPVRQKSQQAYQTEASSSYRSSVKMRSPSISSSYSNIFGEGDVSSNFEAKKLASPQQANRVSGLSSEDLNTNKRGRARRGVTTSQIFF